MHGRDVPLADIERQLFDDLISAGDQSRRQSEPYRFGRPLIDNQFEFERLLHWKICRFRTLENLGHVAYGIAVTVGQASRVGHQTALIGECTVAGHRCQTMPEGKLNDRLAR